MVQKIKRPVSFLLAVVMIASMFTAVPFTASAEDGEICDYTPLWDALDQCGIEALYLPGYVSEYLYNYDRATYTVSYPNWIEDYFDLWLDDSSFIFTAETQSAYLQSLDEAIFFPADLPLSEENQALIDQTAQNLRTAFAQLQYAEGMAEWLMIDISGDQSGDAYDFSLFIEYLRRGDSIFEEFGNLWDWMDYVDENGDFLDNIERYLDRNTFDANRDGKVNFADLYTMALVYRYLDATWPIDIAVTNTEHELYLYAEDVDVEPGGEFHVPVYVRCDSELVATRFKILYDTSAVEVTDVEIGGAVDPYYYYADSDEPLISLSDGEIAFTACTEFSHITDFLSASEQIFIDGVLLTIHGRLKEDAPAGYYPFRFSAQPIDTIEDYVTFKDYDWYGEIESDIEFHCPTVRADLGGILVAGNNKGVGTLQADPAFAGCKLVLRADTVDTQYSRFILSDGTAAIYGIDEKLTYTASIESDSGAVFGTVENVMFSAEDDYKTTIRFDSLPHPVDAVLTVRDADGKNVTSACTIRWTMQDSGRPLGVGNTIRGLTAETTVCYTISLPDSLAAQYAAPEAQTVTVGADGKLTYRLQTLPVAAIQGTVQTVSGAPVRGAAVSLVQQLGAKTSKNTTVMTKADGTFTAEAVADVPLTVTVQKTGYRDLVRECTAGSLGTLTLTELTGAKLLLDLSAKAAGTDSASPLYSAADLDFTVTVDGTAADDAVEKYPYLVLDDGVADGAVITVTATDRSGVYLPATASLTYAENALNTVSLQFTSRGRITVDAASSANGANRLLLFDAGGKFVRSVAMPGLFADSGALDAGAYTVVVLGSSDMIGSLPALSLLSDYGLASGTDYYKTSVTVRNGKLSEVSGFTIPKLDETKFYQTDPDQTRLRANVTTISVGQSIRLLANYAFAEGRNVTDAAVTITLPDACSVVPGSVTLNGYLTTEYTKSGNTLTVPTGGAKGTVRLYVRSAENLYENRPLSFASSLSCTLNGSAFSQPIGTVQIAVKGLEWSVPAKTARRQMTVTGKTIPNATADLYDNDVLVGTARANSAGSFFVTFDLVGAGTRSEHDLYITITDKQGSTLTGSTKHVSYDQRYTAVKKVTMVHGGSRVVFDYEHPDQKTSSYSFAPGSPSFSFTVEIEAANPDLLENVCVITYSSSQVQTRVPVTYQGNGRWVGSQTYTSYTMPYALRVEYDEPEYADESSLEPTPISDVITEYLAETGAEIAACSSDQSAIQAVTDQMETLLSDNAVTTQTLAPLNAEVYTVLGVDPDAGTEDLSDLTEQELAAYLEQLEADIAQTKAKAQALESAPDMEDTQGSFGTCAGMTAESLTADGFTACETESGSFVYCKTDGTLFSYADLEHNLFWQFDLSDSVSGEGQKKRAKSAKKSGGDEWDWRAFRESVMESLEELNSSYSEFREMLDDILVLINSNIREYDQMIARQNALIDQASKQSKKAWAALKAAERQPNAYLNMQNAKRNYKSALQTVSGLKTEQRKWMTLRNRYQAQLNRFNKFDVAARAFTLCTLLRDYVNDMLRLIGLWQSIPDPCDADKDSVFAIKRDIIALASSFTLYLFSNAVFSLVDIATVNPAFIVAMMQVQIFAQEGMNRQTNRAINEIERDIKMLQCGRKLTLDPEKMTMKIGESRWVLPVFNPPEYASALNWMSMDTSVVTVDQNGHVTAVGEGKTTILAFYADTANEMGAYCTVTVKDRKGDDDDDDKGTPKMQISPLPTIDPSGYVCEAVPSNRLEGVTVTCFYSPYEDGRDAQIWDADDYDQMNPLLTDANGYYEWFVPEGWWQVRYEKDGYVTGRSDWLPVPPPQTEVHYAMTSTALPRVDAVNADSDGVEIRFSQYMDLSTVTAETVTVSAGDSVLTGSILPLNAETSFADKDVQYASVFRFVPNMETALSSSVVIRVQDVLNYAGTPMQAGYSKTVSVTPKTEKIETDASVELECGESTTLTLSVLPAEAGAGKTITVTSVSPSVVSVSSATVTANAVGQATITITGKLPGAANILYCVNDTDISGMTAVTVNIPIETCKPVKASIASGSTVEEGTSIKLTTATFGASIYYTTDGSCPCLVDSPSRIPYTGPVTLTENVRIIAYAVKDGCYDSGTTILNYTVNPKKYTVKWYVGNDVIVDEVARGTAIPTPTDPVKEGYTFIGWSPEIPESMPANDLEFTAQFTVNYYLITWLNDDGTQIDTTSVAYGTVPTHINPTKAPNVQYNYTFAGWTVGETTYAPDAIPAVTDDATYKATYTKAVNEYTITWKNEDGTLIDTTKVAYGTVPTHANPTKAADAQYTYTFNGWNPAPVAVTGNATYKATYTTSPSPLATAKADAKDALASYKNAADYRPAQQTELTNAINAGNDAIDAAANTDAVATALANAKAAIDAIKTDAELTAEEEAAAAADLATAKTNAKNALDSYKNAADYRAAQQTELANAIAAGKDAIDAAADTAAVATALANAKAAIDAIKTDAELTAEEEAAAAAELATAKTNAKNALDTYVNADDYRAAEQADLADAIADGKTAIDNAADTAAVATALANAKAAIDAIKTDAQLTAEEAAALAEKAKDWQSVTIDDQISINFLLDATAHAGMQSITITYINQDKETKTIDVDVTTLEKDGDYYKVPAIVAPAQIVDTVTITIVEADGTTTTTYSTSIAAYCEYLIANYNGENARAVRELAKATLEYGRTANDYFAYSTTTITSPFSAAYKEQAIHDAKHLTNTLSATGNIRSKIDNAAFMALTKPEFRFYMKDLTEAEAAELNDKITASGADARFVKNADGAILLEVKGIEAKDMDKVITIDLGSYGTIKFSGNDFARMMANSGDQSIQALGAALYLYGAAAAACFA